VVESSQKSKPELVARMVSCDREPSYAAESIRHFLAGSKDTPLVVYVDGDDDRYLNVCDDRVTTIVAPVVNERRVASEHSAYNRCRLNTLRAVRSVPRGADLLLLEDDIAMSRGWEDRLHLGIDRCRERFGDDFVLALYSATMPRKKEGPVAGYHYRDYYGNVGVVLSCGAVVKFLEVAKQTTVPSDMIVKEMLWKKRIALRQTNPNLVQHLGDVSTTGVRRIIRSRSFGYGFAADPLPKKSGSKRSNPKSKKPVAKSIPKKIPTTNPKPPPKPEPPPKPKYEDKVYVCMATLPEREESLERVVESLRGQVDKLYIYLNGHRRVPAFLRGKNGADCEIWRSNNNDGAVKKLWWANKLNGYLLICDDDIVYPSNYVERTVRAIECYRRRAVVGYHGVIIPEGGFQRYLPDRTVLSYETALMSDTPVHALGTGVIGYHSSTIRVSGGDFPYPNMVDIWFGIACQKRKVPMICLARPFGWLQPLPQLMSIYDSVVQDDTKQSESVLSAWPWTLHTLENNDK
jgi:hypothetical protein